MLKQLNLLLKLLIVVGYYELLRALVLLKLLIVEAVVGESVFEAVESVVKSVDIHVEVVDCRC